MSDVRFLPNSSNTDHTHIGLRSGHSCCVYAVDPKDGKPGTVIPARFHEAAIARGCRLVGLGGHEASEASAPDKTGLIVKAIEAIMERNNPDELNGDGRPSLDAVKKQAGFGVTRVELDTAFEVFIDSLKDE